MAAVKRVASFLLLLTLIVTSGWRTSRAQTEQELYFPETGHYVTGEFLVKYRSGPNPLQLYGYPITDAFEDPITGMLLQYFQKVRFELHPELMSLGRVQLSPLGEYLYQPGESVPVPDNSPACRTDAESGFQICYAFLAFYNSYNAAAEFGRPISNIELHNGRIVQYFQNVRLEWRPELPSGQRVVISDLGAQYFYFSGEDPSLLLPNPGSDIIKGIVALRVRAFPGRAVTAPQGMQTVYVVVQDQRLLPVKDARVTLKIHFPSGQETRYIVPELTNAQGITQYAFAFQTNQIGIVSIEVTASRDNLITHTRTSFRIWW